MKKNRNAAFQICEKFEPFLANFLKNVTHEIWIIETIPQSLTNTERGTQLRMFLLTILLRKRFKFITIKNSKLSTVQLNLSIRTELIIED